MKEAATLVRKVSFNGRTSLVEVTPLHGRTHQIRLHLQHLGHPIANDPCYGGVLHYGDATAGIPQEDPLLHKKQQQQQLQTPPDQHQITTPDDDAVMVDNNGTGTGNEEKEAVAGAVAGAGAGAVAGEQAATEAVPWYAAAREEGESLSPQSGAPVSAESGHLQGMIGRG